MKLLLRTALIALLTCISLSMHNNSPTSSYEGVILSEAKDLNRFTVRSLGSAVIAQEPMPTKIKLLTLLGRPLQLVAAEKLGLFSKFGLEVETENSPTSEELRAKLAAGIGDLAYLAVDNAVAMVDLAHQNVVIVMGGEGSQNELIAQPDIKSIKELRGKTVIVDAPNTAYAVQLKKILLLSGLQAGKDYEIKPVGATPQRLIAMRENKSYAASMLGPPSSIIAKREGFVSLGSVQESIGSYQAAGFFAERKRAQDHRETLIDFLAAIIEAQRWLLTPANKSEVLALWSKETHLAPQVAAETYESSMTMPGGFAKDAAFDLAGFQNVLKLRAEIEGSWGGHPPAPEKYYDSSYYTAALAKLKSKPRRSRNAPNFATRAAPCVIRSQPGFGGRTFRSDINRQQRQSGFSP